MYKITLDVVDRESGRHVDSRCLEVDAPTPNKATKDAKGFMYLEFEQEFYRVDIRSCETSNLSEVERWERDKVVGLMVEVKEVKRV